MSPGAGIGHYLRDLVYGANDGIITTLAVVAGASGAQLPARVGIILGLANLVADGLSMGASNYLGMKSEIERDRGDVARENPVAHGGATALAFAVAGAIPLAAYALPFPLLASAAILSGVALFAVGAARAAWTGKSRAWSGIEMLLIGGFAGAAAFGVGALVEQFV